MTWLSARTLRTMSELQRQYALACLDPPVSTSTTSSQEATSYNTSKCRMLYAQMHSTDPVRCFKASQAWSIAHFLYHLGDPEDHGVGSGYHSDTGGARDKADTAMARRLLEKPGMLGMEEIRRLFVWNERLVVGVGWIWLVRPYPPPHATPQTAIHTPPPPLLHVIRVPAGKSPTTCPSTHHPCLPILGVNLWEHAYTADFGTDRAAYVREWWGRVRWGRVAPVLAGAASLAGGHARACDEQWVRYAS